MKTPRERAEELAFDIVNLLMPYSDASDKAAAQPRVADTLTPLLEEIDVLKKQVELLKSAYDLLKGDEELLTGPSKNEDVNKFLAALPNAVLRNPENI